MQRVVLSIFASQSKSIYRGSEFGVGIIGQWENTEYRDICSSTTERQWTEMRFERGEVGPDDELYIPQ